MNDAAKLAENSAIFAAVSPGMDLEKATDGLVSILKAYQDISVDDSLDGIISKINQIGNTAALSNEDIVDALTRSSSAMSAANNSLDETIALVTAATEVVRDSATVGQAMKTISMRLRSMDEETEEFSDDIAVLTGQIADLTKTAGNGGKGVSLFEAGDPNTYRSTYDILKDIAAVWDEISDKNQAQLLEAMFGKRQAQVGAALLSNFKAAEKAMDEMANSAGSAEREMAKVMDSVQYRANALKETWVGVAQNMLETDDMKAVLAFFQALSDTVDVLTDKLGLFGTVGVAGAITFLKQFIDTAGEPKATGSVIAPAYTPMATWNEQAA